MSHDHDYEFDIGDNAQELGFAYLFFRYVWPLVLIVIGAAILFGFLRWFLPVMLEHPIQFIKHEVGQRR